MIVIRDFAEADREEIQQIYLLSRHHAFHWMSPTSFQLSDFEKDTEGERICVAEIDNRLAGFISIWMPDNFIHHLFVHPNFKKKGIGKALLNAGIAQLNGPASLKCLKQNKNAVSFYQANGWEIESEGGDGADSYFLMTCKN